MSASRQDSSFSISRRSFLKASAAGVFSALLALRFHEARAESEDQGRVLDGSIKLYDAPSFQGKELATFWRDMLLPISEVTLGDLEPAHNRVWYKVDGEGYVHSGAVQPVHVQLNPVVAELPETGALAEVTVPFTDAHWKPSKKFPVAYRLYYETTHWVSGLFFDESSQPWYRLAEDKWKLSYYAPAAHLRLIPPEELGPLSPEIPPHARRIEVRTAEQVVIAYENDHPIFMAKTATGAKFSNGDFSTPPGRYITAHKRPSRHMAAGNLAANGYDLPGVPWISYITESGISFHGTYWHNNFGRPRSHGCINLSPKAARWVYLWTSPSVPASEQSIHEEHGTAVDVL
ncbi:MAG: L,D-transpeptidase [Chloroflexi bacterium]|nr:L,D-transpeptidase [Chloroflexota bacterium]